MAARHLSGYLYFARCIRRKSKSGYLNFDATSTANNHRWAYRKLEAFPSLFLPRIFQWLPSTSSGTPNNQFTPSLPYYIEWFASSTAGLQNMVNTSSITDSYQIKPSVSEFNSGEGARPLRSHIPEALKDWTCCESPGHFRRRKISTTGAGRPSWAEWGDLKRLSG